MYTRLTSYLTYLLSKEKKLEEDACTTYFCVRN